MSDSAVIRAWWQEFAEGALASVEVDDFVRRIDAEIIAEIPEIAADPVLIEDLHASTRAHWRNFLVGLSDQYQLALPPSAVALSLSIARRHHDINVLLKVYRVANRGVFRYFAEHTATETLPPGLPRDVLLIATWQRAERWIDESIEQLIGHYTQERASLAEGARARRAELIEALVAGAEPGADAERVLGHRLGAWQTAFVLSAAPAAADDADNPALFDVAARACQLLGLPAPLTMLSGSRELWGWAATAEEPVLDLAAVADEMTALGLHLALGRPGHGPGAFRISHLQALAAQRIGLRGDGSCHDYAEIELVGLIGDGELARQLVGRELGPLLTGARGEDQLRATALAYLRGGQSVDRAASELFVHPNTVRYRISRIEEQLGCRITDRAAVLELCLRWVEVYGADVL